MNLGHADDLLKLVAINIFKKELTNVESCGLFV